MFKLKHDVMANHSVLFDLVKVYKSLRLLYTLLRVSCVVKHVLFSQTDLLCVYTHVCLFFFFFLPLLVPVQCAAAEPMHILDWFACISASNMQMHTWRYPHLHQRLILSNSNYLLLCTVCEQQTSKLHMHTRTCSVSLVRVATCTGSTVVSPTELIRVYCNMVRLFMLLHSPRYPSVFYL